MDAATIEAREVAAENLTYDWSGILLSESIGLSSRVTCERRWQHDLETYGRIRRHWRTREEWAEMARVGLEKAKSMRPLVGGAK